MGSDFMSAKAAAEKHLDDNNYLPYLKMHGSTNWRDSSGNHIVIIGTNKKEDIDKYELTKWYNKYFYHILTTTINKLLIIGYGFMDKHINEALIKGMTSGKLKVYVLDNQNPRDFKNKMTNKLNENERKDSYENRRAIYNFLAGYFPYSLEDIYREENKPLLDDMKAKIFDYS